MSRSEPYLAGLATDTAVIVIAENGGTLVGAVYSPDGLIEPQDPPTQPIPLTLHVTDVFAVPITVAENCCRPPVASTTWFGYTVTETVEGATIVRVALAVAVTSASEVAVTVTLDGEGAIAGAV
jgi:hypothetical protein